MTIQNDKFNQNKSNQQSDFNKSKVNQNSEKHSTVVEYKSSKDFNKCYDKDEIMDEQNKSKATNQKIFDKSQTMNKTEDKFKNQSSNHQNNSKKGF